MNFKKQGVLLGALLIMWCLTLAAKDPEKNNKEKGPLMKGAGTPRYGIINIGNITSWMRSDGQSNHAPSGDNGMYYPRGTGNVIYQDCINWSAKLFTDAGLTRAATVRPNRAGGGSYLIGTKEGWVTGQGANAVPASGNDANVRVWRVRRDYASMSDAEAEADAASYNEVLTTDVTAAMIASMKAQYDLDWTTWGTVIPYGAPYIERNGTPGYQAPPAFTNITDKTNTTFTVDSLITQNRDEPGIAGIDPNSPADQVSWTVYNDLDITQALNWVACDPIGIEVSKTMWAYKRSDALGNLYFTKYRLINKGGVDTTTGVKGSFWLDSMYVCQWSDPDLGNFSDDLVGCDTTLSMGFIYNANAIDGTFQGFGYPPPAAGYDFLQGPIVSAPGDSGVFDLKKRYNVRNLGMSAFAYFSAGSPYTDPPQQQYQAGAGRWFKMHRGYAPLGDFTTSPIPYVHGSFPQTKFPLSGDPIAGSGFLDGEGDPNVSFAPGDRRLLVITGPFQMAPGDTQEIVMGVVVGLGSDRLSSVAVLKFNDRFAQNTYNALFAVPKPPKPPTVKIAELDGQIVLEWGSDLAGVADIENRVNNPGSYRFEGYNVYQLPTRGSRLAEAKRIVTFDQLTDPTVVLDQQFDNKSGQILNIPVQFGGNSGISRFLNLKRDYIRDIDKLWNGQEYYYVVTAYSIATVPGFLPAALESDALVNVARPRSPFGKVYATGSGDTVKVTHTAGSSEGIVRPIVINPAASTGDTYEVRFDTAAGNTTWRLRNVTKNTTVTSGETNQDPANLAGYKILEGGIYLKVEGPPPGVKDALATLGTRRITFAGAEAMGFEGFSGAIGWDEPNNYFNGAGRVVTAAQLKNVVLRFAQAGAKASAPTGNGTSLYGGWDENTAGNTDVNFSYAYRYLRGATGAAARPEFASYIVNTAASYGYQDYKYGVPLSAWDVEASPPQRLAVGFLENNVAGGLVDGKYYPPGNQEGANNNASTGPREWMFIMNSPYTAAVPSAAFQVTIVSTPTPVMYWVAALRRSGDTWSEATGTNEFTILANHVNLSGDVFSYTLPAPTTGADLEKASAAKVGVFPNPYYAQNAAETSRFSRFVTFNNLPTKTTIRIFNLAGQLVKVIEKNDASQFVRWDLLNRFNFPVASGVYIAHVDMPDVGATQVLKMGIIQEQEILPSF